MLARKTPRTGMVAGPRSKPAAAPPVVLVTYRGAIDPKDRTREVVMPRERPLRDEIFPFGQQVKTTSSTAARLEQMAGHTFDIKPASPEGD
jgi:hypothetical protein